MTTLLHVSKCSRPFILRSEKLQTESSPNFSIFRPEFCPEFCSEFSPNFSRTFRASFRGRRRPEKIHQKSPPFFNAKFPGKHEKNIHKILLESRQSNLFKVSKAPFLTLRVATMLGPPVKHRSRNTEFEERLQAVRPVECPHFWLFDQKKTTTHVAFLGRDSWATNHTMLENLPTW